MKAESSLVLELQRLAQDSSTSITELLRRAKVVASKLGLDQARAWIDSEMNGYSSVEGLPKYRIVPSELSRKHPYRGWQPVLWESANVLQEHFSQDTMTSPISEIEPLVGKGGVPHTRLNQGEIDALLQSGNHELLRFEVGRVYPPSAFTRIVEAVRTKILEFALDLERRGVLGEGMTFKDTEKREASAITFNVNSVGTFVHGDHTHATGRNAKVEQTSYSAGQVGAQGPQTMATGNALSQGVTNAWSTKDQQSALEELGKLRAALAKRIDNADDAMELGRVGQVEDAASRGDVPRVDVGVKTLAPKTRTLIKKLKLGWLLKRIAEG